jgi:hypothetical protein
MQNLGWDGGSEAATRPGLREQGRAVCLCFEGGAGTVGTVAASVKNRTPVLIIQGTGRAADLIADCLDVFAEMHIVDSYEASLVSLRSIPPTTVPVTKTPKVEQWAELRERIKNLLTKPEDSESEDTENCLAVFDAYRVWPGKAPAPKEA